MVKTAQKGVNSMLRYSTSTPAVIVIRILLKLSKEDNRRGWKKMKENRRITYN